MSVWCVHVWCVRDYEGGRGEGVGGCCMRVGVVCVRVCECEGVRMHVRVIV